MRIENVAHVWEAFAAPGVPLCIAGQSTKKNPEGLSVSMYFSGKGKLKGVTVWDGDAERFLAIVGKVPTAALDEAKEAAAS